MTNSQLFINPTVYHSLYEHNISILEENKKMPYTIQWEEKGVYIKSSGQITAKDNLQLNGELYGNKNFDTIEYQISDLLDADLSILNKKDISVISQLDFSASVWNKDLKVAHITKNTELIRLIKIYEERMEKSGWQFMIFDTVEEARKWVSIPFNK